MTASTEFSTGDGRRERGGWRRMWTQDMRSRVMGGKVGEGCESVVEYVVQDGNFQMKGTTWLPEKITWAPTGI